MLTYEFKALAKRNILKRGDSILNGKLLEKAQSHRLAATIVILAIVFLATVYAFSNPLVNAVNDATKVDASQHVSNMSCGLYSEECPGELECFTDFDEERVGANISGHRCVTPEYDEYHCGIFEVTYDTDIWPSSLDCLSGDYSALEHFMIIGIFLQEDPLKWIFSHRNGVEMIEEQGLELAKEAEN